jgi:hypothetical protein
MNLNKIADAIPHNYITINVGYQKEVQIRKNSNRKTILEATNGCKEKKWEGEVTNATLEEITRFLAEEEGPTEIIEINNVNYILNKQSVHEIVISNKTPEEKYKLLLELPMTETHEEVGWVISGKNYMEEFINDWIDAYGG